MRRILLLAATMALALVLVGGVALSKQHQDESTSPQSPTTSKKSGDSDISVQSTIIKASFASGSGANFLGVRVTDHGNLRSFESPAGREQVFDGNEGYALCSGGLTVNGHDTGSVEGGFGTPTFSQPNGTGTFPLTVTRNTTDGKFQLMQVWNKPDAIEKDVTLTMTLTNRSSSAIQGVLLARSGDFDAGGSSIDRGASTGDSVWLWDDISTGDPGGLMLSALTFGTSHSPRVELGNVWRSDGRTKCFFEPSQTTPTDPAGDFAMRMTYSLGTFNAGQSKTVKYVYGRM